MMRATCVGYGRRIGNIVPLSEGGEEYLGQKVIHAAYICYVQEYCMYCTYTVEPLNVDTSLIWTLVFVPIVVIL